MSAIDIVNIVFLNLFMILKIAEAFYFQRRMKALEEGLINLATCHNNNAAVMGALSARYDRLVAYAEASHGYHPAPPPVQQAPKLNVIKFEKPDNQDK